jgi:hypothetical protein
MFYDRKEEARDKQLWTPVDGARRREMNAPTPPKSAKSDSYLILCAIASCLYTCQRNAEVDVCCLGKLEDSNKHLQAQSWICR